MKYAIQLSGIIARTSSRTYNFTNAHPIKNVRFFPTAVVNVILTKIAMIKNMSIIHFRMGGATRHKRRSQSQSEGGVGGARVSQTRSVCKTHRP